MTDILPTKPAFTPGHILSGRETVAAIREGRLSAEQAALLCLDRIAYREPEVKAWAFLDRDTALANARATDAAPSRPLTGLPIGVKDVIMTREYPTRYNCPFYDDPVQTADAACVALLRAAGATVMGKTTTVELASIGRVPATVNPHAFSHTPGGSSGGSAAAVADGHVTVALGTQTGGSILRPASFCGVWALKPTWGLVSTEGAKPFSPSLDTIGWFAREASDLGLVLGAFQAGSPEIPRLSELRIAMWHTPVWAAAGDDTRTAMTRCRVLLEAAGATVEMLELPPLFDELPADQLTIMHAEGARSFQREAALAPDRIAPAILDMTRNIGAISDDALRRAMDRAAEARRIFDAAASRFDAIVSPSTPGAAPAGLHDTGSLIFNGFLTLLHAPAINMPLHINSAGLPVGLTLSGPRWGDAKLVSIACAIARIAPIATPSHSY